MKPEYPEKTTDLPQVTEKTLSHNVVLSTPCLSRIRTHKSTLVVIGTDCTGSYKSNYHTITTTTGIKRKINHSSFQRCKKFKITITNKTNGKNVHNRGPIIAKLHAMHKCLGIFGPIFES
jgi:hypothetical protein